MTLVAVTARTWPTRRPVDVREIAQGSVYSPPPIVCAAGPFLPAQLGTSEEPIKLIDVLSVETHHAYESLVGPGMVITVLCNGAEIVEARELPAVARSPAEIEDLLVGE